MHDPASSPPSPWPPRNAGFSPLVTAAQARAALYSDAATIKGEEDTTASAAAPAAPAAAAAGPLVLDVRTAGEWRKEGHVKGALHIPIDDLRARLAVRAFPLCVVRRLSWLLGGWMGFGPSEGCARAAPVLLLAFRPTRPAQASGFWVVSS